MEETAEKNGVTGNGRRRRRSASKSGSRAGNRAQAPRPAEQAVKEEPVEEKRADIQAGAVDEVVIRVQQEAAAPVSDREADAPEEAPAPQESLFAENREEKPLSELDMLRAGLFSEDLDQQAVEQMFSWVREDPSCLAEALDGEELSGTALLEAVRHGRHVAALLLWLFEPLQPLHGLDGRWARILVQAALWHDLGFAAGGRRRHHKRSMDIIERNTHLSLSFGLEEQDRPLVALLARYHRRAWPSARQQRFAALADADKEALSRASALLRVADALDYTHKSAVEEVRVHVRRRSVDMTCFGSCSCRKECRRALKKGDLFEKLFSRRLDVTQGKEGERDDR